GLHGASLDRFNLKTPVAVVTASSLGFDRAGRWRLHWTVSQPGKLPTCCERRRSITCSRHREFCLAGRRKRVACAAHDLCSLLAAPGVRLHDRSISSSERQRVSGTPT